MKLRSYQQEAIDAIKENFKTKERQFVVMPTGSGKTFTFLFYALNNHKRILIVVPSKDILEQVYDTACVLYSENRISRKGNGFSEKPKDVHICIINSIRGGYLDTLNEIDFDLIIIDEAHHSQAPSYKRLLGSRKIHTKVLGFTATPEK